MLILALALGLHHPLHSSTGKILLSNQVQALWAFGLWALAEALSSKAVTGRYKCLLAQISETYPKFLKKIHGEPIWLKI